MEVIDAIKKRRSIRKFKDKTVSKDLIKELLEAARLAPSAYNSQPWKFVIIDDKKIIGELKKESVFIQDHVYNAPLIIVCCGDISCYPERSKDSFELKDLLNIDVSIAAENLVLRATELGLGTCYVGLVNREKIKKIMKIPENYIIPYVITVGYADENPSATSRKSLNEITGIL
jgi:nitroreductase